MGRGFPHLHVASAYSPHYGVTMLEALVDQAAAAGADFLAFTDRYGLYGAIKHVRACAAAGIRPGLGADLAVHDDEHRPLGRVTLLAHGGGGCGVACMAPRHADRLDHLRSRLPSRTDRATRFNGCGHPDAGPRRGHWDPRHPLQRGKRVVFPSLEDGSGPVSNVAEKIPVRHAAERERERVVVEAEAEAADNVIQMWKRRA
ncbi:PHP domain-containing protein [Cryobacterium sp. TMT2-18-3]|uniref:PHP domain-containing protein n=1 Tax=unclassified Cryobacterium TaxID=2649013 RepID=UPI00106C703E|nr:MULTISPECIES: PHP domain-containing protein [unclassified Cryobacterium]TFC29429.1 PHP domain-containing protein [Cryobacterium sp. TMT2-18-2]TFC61575.1 PHP domain-containing protein [Cryobacterium sp. TMT2-18-3]